MTFAIPISARAEELLSLAPVNFPTSGDAMPAVAITAINDALDKEETHYTDRPGILPLRNKAADYLNARFGTAFNAKSELVITCGVTEARFVSVQQLCKRGARVFSAAGLLSGAAILRDASVADSPADAGLVHLTSSLGEDAIRAIVAKASADAFILYEIDEETSGFHPAAIEGAAARTITIGGILDNGGLAGARIGYLAAPASPAPGLRDFKQALTICSTNLSQWAALAAWHVK